MELDEYKARLMYEAEQREQLAYVKEEGHKEVFSLLRQGYSVDEAEKILGLAK
jgi:hypothetical protein